MPDAAVALGLEVAPPPAGWGWENVYNVYSSLLLFKGYFWLEEANWQGKLSHQLRSHPSFLFFVFCPAVITHTATLSKHNG